MADVKHGTDSRGSLPQAKVINTSGKPGQRNKSTSSCGCKRISKPFRLSPPSLRRLQANMEVENQKTQKMIQTLRDTENGFMKDLENSLNQREVTELRRKELLHKYWDEHVWLPVQKRVEERKSKMKTADLKERASLQKEGEERLKERRTSSSFEAGCKSTRSKVQKLPENRHPLRKSVLSQRPEASSKPPVFPPIKLSVPF